MILKLTTPEIMRALQVYVGAKLGAMPDSLTARVHWRGQFATVDATKAVPTMSDETRRAISE